jgi:hypothetical protein
MNKETAINQIKQAGEMLSKVTIQAGSSLDIVNIYQALQKAIQALEGEAPQTEVDKPSE